MKKKLLIIIAAAVLCLALCAVLLVTCQKNTQTVTISLDQASLSIALDGDPVTLTATLSEGEGTFTWESSDPQVASVDENGVVTPVSKGTATITVKCGKLAPVSCTVTVGDPLHMPVFQADSMGLGTVIALDQGETYQIIDTVTYNGAAVDTVVRFVSLDESIATVSETGLVTAVAMGTGEITVTAEYLGVEIQRVVTVAVQSDISFTAATPQAVSLTKRVTGKCITLVNAEKQITSKSVAVRLKHEGKEITSDIQWQIADGGDEICNLSSKAGEKITVTAVGVGETTVIASAVVDGVKYTVAFGITVEEGAYLVIHTDDGKTEGTTACDGICDICRTKIPVTHADKDNNCVCDWCGATIHADSNFDGICDKNKEHDLRIHLNRHNAGTPAQFAAMVADNADQYIVLDEDLDWSGEGKDNLFGDTYSEYTTVKAIETFKGVLNGQGHTISGFRLGHSGSANHSTMFGLNNGTIKNIGFIFTLATANSAYTGLIHENKGTVENVFVDVTANARSWSTGTIVGISTAGTVHNCISVVNEASTGQGGNLAGAVGALRGGSVRNCYAVGNGHTTTTNAYTERFAMVSASGFIHYTKNNGLLTAVKSFPSGWSSYWAVTEEGITFGGKLVIGYVCEHVDDGKTAGTTACDGICDLCGEAVNLPHADADKNCVCDNCGATIHADENADGICDNNEAHDLRVRLTEANAGTPALFAKIVAENADRYLLVTENLDWSGSGKDNLFGNTYSEYTAVDAIAEFSGVLDGQGHTISGFRLGHSGAANDSAMFLKNSGTIKNIGFIFTLATANSDQTGIVRENKGTIANVFVDMTANARSWTTGPVAGINEGTVRNCIAVINEKSTGKGGNLSGMVGAYRDGSIINCYAVGNGFTTTTNAYTECFNGLATPVYGHFDNNNGLLAQIKTFAPANGWASSWSVTDEGIKFGGRVVVKYICLHMDDGKTTGSTPCDGICDLCGEVVSIAHVDADKDCKCDHCAMILHTDANSDGICDNNADHVLSIQLNKANAGTPALFAKTVSENADKHMILMENLDWSGQTAAGVPSFSGTLDGRGHSITGVTLGLTGIDGDWYTCLIGTNSGTIKNLAIEYKLTQVAGNAYAPVITNSGTLENLFVSASLGAASSYNTAALADINTGTGKVKNCIVVVSTTAASGTATIGPVVYAERNGTVKNCYVVNRANGVTTPYIPAASFGGGSYSGNGVYGDNNALLAAVTALPAADGWTSSWGVSSKGISFGGNVVIAPEAVVCQHKDVSPVDGKCDLCGEEVGTSSGTYYVNSKTAATVADFVALINADLDGTYYLTEDLDYSASGNNDAGIKAFSGILDGQGHTVKGIKIRYNSNDSYETNLFKSNSGTIQNIAFEYSIVAANGGKNALIGVNTGTIRNVYAKATVTKVRTQGYNSPFVAQNTGSSAVVKNCIVNVTYASSITSVDESHGAVVSLNNNGAKVDKCYYKVSGVTVPGIAYAWSTTNNAAVLDATVTSLPVSDGWASYWTVSGGSVKFGK